VSDVWTAPTITFDKASYVVGQLMTMTVTGITDTESVTSTLPAATLSIKFTAADGSTNTVNFPVPPVSQTIVSSPSVSLTSVTDSSGRIWTVAAGSGSLVATATA